MKISDSNPIQFWLTGKTPFNDVEIWGIDKKTFYQSFKTSDHHRTDVKFDFAAAQTWDATVTYSINDVVYSTSTGLRYVSVIDGNLGSDPSLGVGWNFDIPVSLGAWSSVVTYNTNDVVTVLTGGRKYKWKSLSDSNLNNVPIAASSYWSLVIEEANIYKMLAYIGDVFYDDFDFVNVRLGAPNQFVEFDYSIFPTLVNAFLKFKIVPVLLKAYLEPPSSWSDLTSSWSSKTSNTFVKNSIPTGVYVLRSYEPFFAKTGSKVTIKYTVTPSGGAWSGSAIGISFFASDGLGTVVSSHAFDITPAIPPGGGAITVTETITLTANSSRLCIALDSAITSGIPTITVSSISSLAITDESNILASSDCIDVQDNYNSSILIEYTNLVDYDNTAYKDVHPVNKLRIQPAHFWEHQDPREEEDYADSKGDVITLKTKIEKQQKLSISYFPAFMHTKLARIFNHDFIRIDGVIYKGRAAYTPVPIERSTLYAGSVWLTEQGSVLVNIGGQVTGESGGIFDDTFDDTFE